MFLTILDAIKSIFHKIYNFQEYQAWINFYRTQFWGSSPRYHLLELMKDLIILHLLFYLVSFTYE